MRHKKKCWSMVLSVLVLSQAAMQTWAVPVFSVGVAKASTEKASVISKEITKALDHATQYMLKSTSKPQFGSVGGEWAVFGLARRGVKVPKNYYEDYYKHVEEIAKQEHKKAERKWKAKVTETQRLAIAVAAIGKDPTQVGGVNLIDYSFNKGKNMPFLSKNDQVLGNRQGLNELAFGLIAMDLKKTPEPKGAEMTRSQIMSRMIKTYQTADGGFALSAGSKQGEVDLTAMAIQALAPYYKQKGFDHVTKSVDAALKFLSVNERTTCESTAQVVVALCALGINPTTDNRFIKNNKNLIDELLRYQLSNGAFEHIKGKGANQMASEQGFYALVAYERLVLGKSRIYDMTGKG